MASPSCAPWALEHLGLVLHRLDALVGQALAVARGFQAVRDQEFGIAGTLIENVAQLSHLPVFGGFVQRLLCGFVGLDGAGRITLRNRRTRFQFVEAFTAHDGRGGNRSSLWCRTGIGRADLSLGLRLDPSRLCAGRGAGRCLPLRHAGTGGQGQHQAAQGRSDAFGIGKKTLHGFLVHQVVCSGEAVGNRAAIRIQVFLRLHLNDT